MATPKEIPKANRLFLMLLTAALAILAWDMESYSAQAADRISYTISNSSKYQVSLVFLPNGNMASLAPGGKKSCNSPIKNGKFPQVKAHASNNATWLRTISIHGGDYYIVNRGDTEIKIVP